MTDLKNINLAQWLEAHKDADELVYPLAGGAPYAAIYFWKPLCGEDMRKINRIIREANGEHITVLNVVEKPE